MLGFATGERLLVHRLKDGHDTMDIWDAKTNKLAKTFEIPKPSLESPPALSPDGSMLAVSGKDTPKTGGEPVMALFLYDLPSATLRKLPVVDLSTTGESKNTGITFSLDG